MRDRRAFLGARAVFTALSCFLLCVFLSGTALAGAVSFQTGDPMSNGKLVVYDDANKIKDASGGDGQSVNPYNLATMTDTLFTVNYTPFFHVNGNGTSEFGDQRIVVDIPSYGFKLANPGIEGVQFDKITLLDKNGAEIPLDPAAQKNYDKVVKIIYDVNDPFLGSLGSGSSMVFNIAFDRRSLSVQECEKWLNEGRLETALNVAVCEGAENRPINSTGNPPEYKWRMEPASYQDPKTTVTGDRRLNASAHPKITNEVLVHFYDTSPQSGPFMGNKDYYVYTQGTIHDGDTPLMKLNRVKLYAPKSAGGDKHFVLEKLYGRSNLYDFDRAGWFNISEAKDDGDGKGEYYELTPKWPIYNNGTDHKWNAAVTNGFSPIWRVRDGVDDIGSDVLYEAAAPEFVFETPNGTDGSKEVTVSDPDQGVKIKTMKGEVVDNYIYHRFAGPGYQLYKNGNGKFYTANAVSPDANYTEVRYVSLSNEYYILKDANGEWIEYFPKNKTGATIETYEFPKEIQPTQWTGTAQTWNNNSFKVAKVVYTTEDGTEHTAEVNSFVHLAHPNGPHFPKVDFDTSGGRVTKVQVYWEQLNNDLFNASAYGAGTYSANKKWLYFAESKFDYYVPPEANGLLQVKYSAQSTDPGADNNDRFDHDAAEQVKKPVNALSGEAKDDFFWVTVIPKRCTPVKAESVGERLKENCLYPNQAENGAFYDTWGLFFDYGTKKEFAPVTKNPRIDITVGTLNLKGLDSQQDKTGLLTGKFTGTKALSGWKITYKTANNLSGAESAAKVYNVGDIADGTKIDLGIDRSAEHLSSLVISYDGDYNIAPFADKETGRAFLFSGIEYELRNTDFKGNPLTIEKEKGAWYGPNYFVQNLEGKYFNDNCTDSNHVHNANKGQAYGGRAWNAITFPQRYGLLTRTYIVTNKTADNVISNTGDSTINSISQMGTCMQKVTFKTTAYAYAMNSDVPERGQMPYGIPEYVYVEIKDKQFSADVDNCKFLGFDNASGNAEIKQVTDADGKAWIKMALTDAGKAALNKEIREITKNGQYSYYYWYNPAALKFMEDPAVIALKSFRYTSVTTPGENEHYPYGMVYYDMSALETKLDGSKKEYYSYARLDGDLYKLTDSAAAALDATKDKKLFGVNLGKVQVVVSKSTAVGSSIFPGKYDAIVYGTAGSQFPTQKFYPDEKDNLRADFFVQAPDSDGFKQYKAIIEIPKLGKAASYIRQDALVQTPETGFDMFMSGEASVTGDSRPGKQEFTYSIDGGATYRPANQISDWSKVTHVQLDLGELPKGSQVNIKLPLKTNGKTTTDELEAYIGGRFEATDYTGFKMNGYINPAKYVYGNFAVISSDVWWDRNENGLLEDGESKAGGVRLELYSPDHDITIHDKVIPANTFIDASTTDNGGTYELKSYMLNEGQWVKVVLPDGAELTLKSKDADMLKPKNSDFHRENRDTLKLPELVREKPLDTIGCGLIRPPVITTETVRVHVGSASQDAAANAGAASDHPTVTPVIKYVASSDAVADVTVGGKVTAKTTGKTEGEVVTKNTLADGEQAIANDTVRKKYDIISYANVVYKPNHVEVTGFAPTDGRGYYPSADANGNDADTDKATVLGAGTMERAGHLFKGWNTKPDGKGTAYLEGDTFKTGVLDKDVTLYAVWFKIPFRTIKVHKVWKIFDEAGVPTGYVKVELFKDGKKTDKTLLLSAGNDWRGVFENLDVADWLGDAVNFQYTIREAGEKAGAVKYGGKRFTVGYAGNMDEGFEITNTGERPVIIPPKTGDGTNLSLYLLAMAASSLAAALLGSKRRRKAK